MRRERLPSSSLLESSHNLTFHVGDQLARYVRLLGAAAEGNFSEVPRPTRGAPCRETAVRAAIGAEHP